MPNFTGSTPIEINRFCGFIDLDDPTNLPIGAAALARNCKFTLTSVKTRYGLQLAIQGSNESPITGLIGCIYTPITAEESFVQQPLLFDLAGLLQLEAPVGTGRTVPVTSPIFTPPVNSHMIGTQAYNSAFIAFSDLLQPTGAMGRVDLGLARDLLTTPNVATLGKVNIYNPGAIPGGTLPGGIYYGFITVFTAEGEVSQSPEVGPINNNHGWINAQIPFYVGAVKWRLYVTQAGGAPGTENQYVEFTEAAVAGFGRTVGIGAAGTGGTPNLVVPFFALDPYGMKPVGGGWIPNHNYIVGEIVTPSVVVNGTITARTTGHTYRCISAGLSGPNQPIWPTATNGTVTETVAPGTTPAQWEEYTTSMVSAAPGNLPDPVVAPTITRAPNQGAFASGRDVYIRYTWLNISGETLPSPANYVANTVLNDGVQVVVPDLPGQYISGVNVYEADVVHGAGAPATAAFTLVGTYQPGDEPIVTTTGAGGAPPVANTAAIQGNIKTGIRYMMVVYFSRSGAMSGATVQAVQNSEYNVTVANELLSVSNIPIGPLNVTKRRVGFTVAGGTAAGPFYYIPQSIVSGGVAMTATEIEDNITTSAKFNFTDEFLIGSSATDITDRLQVIEPYPCVDAYYSPSTGRIFQCGVPGFLSGCVISLADDVESYYRSGSLLPIGADDGQRTICVREFQEIVFALRERSGFVITPTAGVDPSQWPAVQRWGPTKAGETSSVGPCGPRAVAVCQEFMFFVHRSGGYLYESTQPECVTKEIQKFWNTINWKAQHTIWCSIDEEEKEVHIGLPVGGSPVPNIVLTVNYEEGWNSPLAFSRYAQKVLTIEACRKYSVDDIQAFVGCRIERTIPDTPIPNEGPVQTEEGPIRALVSQFLYGSSGPDGTISAITPGVYNDNGGPIDWQYEPTSTAKMMALTRLKGYNLNALGNGPLQVSFLAGRDMVTGLNANGDPARSRQLMLRAVDLAPDQHIGISRSTRSKVNERWRAHLSNGNQPDVWAEIKYMAIFISPLFSGRTVLEGN